MAETKYGLSLYRNGLLPGLILFASIFALPIVQCTTDASDVGALQVMYLSLNSPSQLTNWKNSGGDPCIESWKGITCEGSAVVSIKLSGLGLNGTMGYLLSDLVSLRKLDLSDNKFHDAIPYQLPPNLTSLNLANNNLSGGLPYSFSNMVSLKYLNVSRNSLSQSMGDIFANLADLATLDLSFNNFSGDLPDSFASLSRLSTLDVESNQLTGSINVLSRLPLTKLNVANNHFTGWIPQELRSTEDFVYDGNHFDNGPAPRQRQPPYISPPAGKSHDNHSQHRPSPRASEASETASSHPEKSWNVGAVIGIILGSVFLGFIALLAFAICMRKRKKSGSTSLRNSLPVSNRSIDTGMQDQRAKDLIAVADLTPLPAEKPMTERMHMKNGSVKRTNSSLTVTSYTVASLQSATNSFSQEFLIGEGSFGRVYKAEFPNRKVMAVKKIDNAALSLQKEDNFLEAVSNMSRLRHPNIVKLAGYCAEHGQRLLVHEYIGNGSLHDILHFSEESGKTLTWNARIRVALGTARALEYLHEVCSPSVVHRNFKSANILLDEELNPHLADCGLAALTPNTERQAATQMVASLGYSAPEFALSGIYTTKSDVYSFGVVMLELLTGRKPLDSSRVRSEQSLVRWATPQLHDIDALAKMVDPALNGMYPAKSLSRFADIIAICVQDDYPLSLLWEHEHKHVSTLVYFLQTLRLDNISHLFSVQPEPEFRPPMSEVVQQLVRLVQRASVVKRHPGEDSGFAYRTPDHEAVDISS